MGFNPHAKTRKGPADYLMVAAALLVCLALLAWALLGRRAVDARHPLMSPTRR